MPLPGYIRKTRPAIWLSVRGAVPVAASAKQPKPSKPSKPQKFVSPRSKLRAKQMAEYVPKMLAFLALNRKCQRCGDVSTCVHHFAGRRGRQLLVEKDWRASCSSCNIFAKEHPKEARVERWLAPVGEYRT